MGVLESDIFRDWYGTAEMREVFSDRNTIQQWLNVEAALAEAEAEIGLLPADAARKIAAQAKAELIPLETLQEKYRVVGYPILPLLQVWEKHLGDEAAWVHFGATTQDITDTGMVLQLRQALALL
jgi:3-carboxy-cis,cis-muconate cycloisomerase